ncbi:MAG: hypothetical protein PHR35_04350 [Kiritimatiellae bacterium]|nr:hypothetical protein [Kiritimatiellia bacterium]
MSISARLFELIRKQTPGGDTAAVSDLLREGMLQDDQRERLAHDRQILEDPKEANGEIEREAQRQLREAAETSLRRLHVIQRGRCPQCGEHLRQHLFATICDSCGWNAYDAPRHGSVRVHLAGGSEVIDGERCYLLKDGALLLLRNDVVVARLQPSAVGWVEYIWDPEELDQRHKEVLDRLTISCAWCNKVADPETDGFHMVQVAFGASQERHCFCCDECYEAFRKMYPARVHRNCYERSCSECNLCLKRYEDEAEGIRTLAKDHMREKRRPGA